MATGIRDFIDCVLKIDRRKNLNLVAGIGFELVLSRSVLLFPNVSSPRQWFQLWRSHPLEWLAIM